MIFFRQVVSGFGPSTLSLLMHGDQIGIWVKMTVCLHLVEDSVDRAVCAIDLDHTWFFREF